MLSKGFESDSEKLKDLQPGEVLEMLEGPRKARLKKKKTGRLKPVTLCKKDENLKPKNVMAREKSLKFKHPNP